MALYATIQYPNDFKNCSRISVNHSGYSDGIACIARSILGAYHGMKIIPPGWLDSLTEKYRMELLLNNLIKFFKEKLI